MLDARLFAIAVSMFGASPPILRIRATRDWGETADHLRDLIREARLESLAPQVEAFIEVCFRDDAPLMRMLEETETFGVNRLVGASQVARTASTERKVAAFILSVISLLLLAKPFRSIVDGPRPHYSRWSRIPEACANLAIETGSIWAARDLVHYVYGLLDSYRPQDRNEIKGDLEAWRLLGQGVERRMEFAIGNLADDLRESCRPAAENFRAEVGAITWTLGLVPESTVFRASASEGVIPSPRFFRRLVRHSLFCMGTDALLQYVWLELKDRGPFDIRQHESLFPIINSRYNNVFDLLGGLFGTPLPQLYARNLIAWFRGQVDPGEARTCMDGWLGIAQIGGPDDAALSRGVALALLLAEADNEAWVSLVTQPMQQWRTEPQQNPNLRLLRSGVPQFHVNERQADVTRIIDLLERQHARALTYWLDIGSPVPTDEERSRLGALLDQEADLASLLRGTFFEMLLPILPEHYWYYGLFGPAPDPNTASFRYVKLKSELRELREVMRTAAPSYLARRADQRIGFLHLVKTLGAPAL